jgi:5-methylcytosine-specific restriction endonuclease McrA
VTNDLNSPAWKRVRLVILERDRFVCRLELPGCTGRATEVDHVVPRKFGGTEALSNLRAACRSCNRRRGDGTSAPRAIVSAW